MSPPINLDGDTVDAITMDGESVGQVTVDGSAVFNAIPDNRVENFEDGDITISLKSNWSGWNGDTGSLSAQQTTVLAGAFSAEHVSSGGTFNDVTADRDTADTPSEAQVLFRADSQNGNALDGFEFLLRSGTTRICGISMRSDGSIEDQSGNDIGGSWAANTTYLLRVFNIDYTNDQFDIEVIDQTDGSTVTSTTDSAFDTATSDVDQIFLRNDSNDGSGQTAYWDNVDWGAP